MAGIDSNTKFLAQMNGDMSAGQHNTTFMGANMELEGSDKKFGYGSAHFGNAGYITLPSHSDFTFGTGDFTVDFWAKFDAIGESLVLCGRGSSGTSYWLLYYDNGGPGLRVIFQPDAVGIPSDTFSPNDVDWYHIALVRESNQLYFFINGVSYGGDSYTGNVNQSGVFTVGTGLNSGGNPFLYFKGNIDEFRISDTARWTSGFSVPTTEYAVDANTVYLNHFEGDISNNDHDIAIIGTPIVSATESKWHGSLSFDGSTDKLTVASNSDFDIRTGEFTIDMWLHVDDLGAEYFFSIGNSNYNSMLFLLNGATLYMSLLGSTNGSSWNVSMNDSGLLSPIIMSSWNHIALVRTSDDYLKLFNNGILIASLSNTSFLLDNYNLVLGGTWSTSFGECRLDEFRISDTARWTENFDVPLEPYSRFYYTVSGDVAQNSTINAYDVNTHELVTSTSGTPPSYSMSVESEGNPVHMVAIPTSGAVNIAAYRDITPIIS